ELHSLVARWKESAAPVVLKQELAAGAVAVSRHHNHKGGKVFVQAAQPVGDPGAGAGPARLLSSAQEQAHPRRVVDGFGMHRLHEAEIVRNGSNVGKQIADPGAARSMLLELELARLNRQLLTRGHRGEPLAHSYGIRQELAAV